MKKQIVIKVVIACLIAGGVGTGGYYGYTKYKASKNSVATTAQYINMRATKTNLEVKIQGTGAVFAGTSRDITNSSNGEVKDLNVNVGDTVTKDSALFTISNDSLQQAIDKAQNSLDKQKLQLSNAKSTLTTAQQTLADAKTAAANTSTTTDTNGQTTTQSNSTTKTISVEDAQAAVNKAKLDVSTAELAVKDAERDLTSAKTAKTAATVKSPITGLVIAKNKYTGDSVQANTAVLTVIDTNSLKVNVAVDELDIQKVKTGQKAQISLGAIEGKTYEGTVEQIALTGKSSNNVTTYDVTVSISNPENIKLGMNATVNILVESKENALVIPAEALIESNGKKYVRIPNTNSSTPSTAANSTTQGSAPTQGTTAPQGNEQTNSQQSQNSGSSSTPNAAGQNSGSTTSTTENGQTRQNKQAGQTGQMRQNTGITATGTGKLVEIKTGLETENYIEVLEGITEGQQVLVTLPQTSTTTTTNRNNISGFPGGTSGLNGSTGGGNRQMPTGGAPKN